jgi:hypothetical protein
MDDDGGVKFDGMPDMSNPDADLSNPDANPEFDNADAEHLE